MRKEFKSITINLRGITSLCTILIVLLGFANDAQATALPTTSLGTYANVSGTAINGAEPVLEAIASTNDSTYVYDNTNTTHTGSANFALGDMPPDFGTMDTASIRLRYGLSTNPANNTWDSLTAQIFQSDGSTALSNAVTIASNITTTTPANSSVIPLTGLNTSADKATWNGALVRINWGITRIKGGDSAEERVFAAEVTGTYTSGASTITISGTCRQADQSTACSDTGGNSIRVAVNGTLQAQTDATVDGSWSIASVTQPTAGQIITVFIEGEASSASQAVAVTEWSSGDVTGVELIESHLTIGSNQGTTISNADLGDYDSSVSGKRTFHDNSGTTLTVDADSALAGEELYIGASNTYTPGGTVNTHDLEIRGTFNPEGNTINVSGEWDDNGTFNASTSTIAMTGTSEVVGDGSTFNNLTINPSSAGTITASGSFTVSGTLNVASGDALSLPAATTLTHSGSTLTLDGTISGQGTLRETASGFIFPTGGIISSYLTMDTVNGNQTLSARTYGQQILIENSGSTAGRTVTLGVGTHNFNSISIAESGTGSVTLTGSANNPDVNFSGSNAISCSIASNNLVTGSGTWTMAGGLSFNFCTTTITSGNTLVMNGSGTFTSAGNTLQNVTLSGTITLANATHTIAGNLNMAGGTITPGSSTITMSGTNNTITGGGNTLSNLTIDPSSAGTITMQTSNLIVSGTLTVSANDKFRIESGRTLTLSGTGTPLSVSGTFEPDDGSTVIYTGSATVTGTTFGNLTLGDGADTITLPNSSPTIKGNLVIASGATIASGSATLLFRAGTTQSITDNNGTKQNLGEIAVRASTGGNTLLTLGGSVKVSSVSVDPSQSLDLNGSNTLTIQGSDNVFNINGTFIPQTGTVQYTGGSPNVSSANYNHLILGGTGAYTLPSSGTPLIGGDLTITSGATVASGSATLVFDSGTTQSITDNTTAKQNLGEMRISANGGNTTLTLGSSVRISSASVDASQTMNLNGSNTLTITGTDNSLTASGSFGTFTPSTGTVVFTGNGLTNIPTLDYFNLKVQPSANSTTHTFNSGTASVSGLFTVGNGTNTGVTITADTNNSGLDVASVSISANTTLVADGSSEFTVSRDFVNNGTFTHSSGLVTFEGPRTSSISGATTFNNFTATTPGKKIKFGAQQIFTFAGTFTITGADGNNAKIESTASASQWLPHFNSAQSAVTYATITDSGCDAGSSAVTLDSTSTNGGNNDTDCWVFPVSATFTQNDWEWFYDNDELNPAGSVAGAENLHAEIGTTTTLVRLRMNLTVGGTLSATSQQFKLQYSSASENGPWDDVSFAGGAKWIFTNTSVADGATLDTSLLSTTSVLQTYNETNPTINSNPNSATDGQNIEYDWALDPQNAKPGRIYYFRIIKSDGSPLDAYNADSYPCIRVTVPIKGGGGGGASSPGGGGNSGGGQQRGGGNAGGNNNPSNPDGGGDSGGGEATDGGTADGGGGASPVIFDWFFEFITTRN